jgi:hypothetical protein
MTHLPELEIVWPTRSRTGSTFLVQLTTTCLGFHDLAPTARVNGARADKYRPEEKDGEFREMFRAGQGLEYLARNRIKSLKFEDPGKDDFVREIAEAAPSARFVTSSRRLERVLESHFNIRAWGHGEADVLHQFSACLTLFEELYDAGRLFMVEVDEPQHFDGDAFARFLGLEALPRRARRMVEEWQPVNDLKYQVEKRGDAFEGRQTPPRLERLRQIHPWIGEVEERYTAMSRRTRPPLHAS